MSYGLSTDVPVERSKRHIEELLTKAGAEGYHTGWQAPTGSDPGWDAVEFLWRGKQIRFRLPRRVGAQRIRGRVIAEDQFNRARWRVLCLVVKAKIEAVEAGISVFEEEFLSFIVTANGKTVGEVLLPRLAASKGPLQLTAGEP